MLKVLYYWYIAKLWKARNSKTRFRRDFRIVGLRDNDKGFYAGCEMFDCPDELPPGYPDKAPVGKSVKKYKRVPDRKKTHMQFENPEGAYCKESMKFDPDEFCTQLTKMNMTGVLDEFILQHKQLNPSWNPPRIDPTEFQVQVFLQQRILLQFFSSMLPSELWLPKPGQKHSS